MLSVFQSKKKRKGPYVLKTGRKKGRSKIKYDKRIRALKPGKRISKKGKIYYEYRANRSDAKGRIRGSRKYSRRGNWLWVFFLF
mgnify:CR=1 FL=1